MQTVARGAFQPSARSWAFTRTLISPRSYGGQGGGELARRRPTRDGSRLDADGPHRRRHASGVVHARRVDDAGSIAEPVEVEQGGRHVQRLVVERCRELLLVEVAADDLHPLERGPRTHADGAERRDDALLDRLVEREVRDLGREDVADVLLQQLVGGRHADVRRRVEPADGRGRAVAEGGVGLVAQHHAVDVARDRVGVADEPGVGLDAHGRDDGRSRTPQHRVLQP
jgi:hypothetical protein